jgi:proline utilization trans-activator
MMEGEQGPASIIPQYVAQRRKQACSRCHTKRIKCLGGVPCRNCIISASPCTFPPPTKRARTASASFTPLLPVIADNRNSAAGRGTDTTIAPPTPGNYRRTEKVFASSKSSHDARGERPNYAGSPSCLHFVKKFNDWLSSLRETLAKSQNYFFDTTWLEDDTIGPQAGAHSLEITISTTSDTQASAHQSMKPSSIRLPPYNYSIHLIQVLEDSVAHEQHLFRRKELRAKVWQMHQNPDSPQSKDQGWLCHWLSVAALGELHNALPAMRTDTETPGSYYYHQSVALLPQVAENPDVQYIATLSMLCLYAFSLNRLHTAYMYAGISLRAALALKLHRDPSEQQIGISNLPELELEHRKRLFWTVYYQDLLTTCTTASPWGVLDDEITVGYPSPSASQSGDFLLEFADSECLNQHLELMRLRSQGYSSLYGYAGTAINPFSHICLMDHELGQPLTSQHLDKSLEFYDSLVSWETELPPSHRVHKGWDGAMLNLNRINATLYLIYYQVSPCETKSAAS